MCSEGSELTTRPDLHAQGRGVPSVFHLEAEGRRLRPGVRPEIALAVEQLQPFAEPQVAVEIERRMLRVVDARIDADRASEGTEQRSDAELRILDACPELQILRIAIEQE